MTSPSGERRPAATSKVLSHESSQVLIELVIAAKNCSSAAGQACCSSTSWGSVCLKEDQSRKFREIRSGDPKWLRTPRPATEPRDGPSRNFHEKYRKNTPRPEILEPQENSKKIPKNTKNAQFWYFGAPEQFKSRYI